MIGKSVGFLTVISETNLRDKRRNKLWKCICDCGKIVLIGTATINACDKKSCGCKSKSETSGTHGFHGSRTYNTWRTMIERCTKPYHKSYEVYKNVTIDDKWLTFEGFYSDMGDRPEGVTLDRIEWSKGYTKSNCRWATGSTQQQNKPPSERNKHGYPGVFESRGKFCARIRYDGKREYLGSFNTPEEAHSVYDAKGREVFGEEWVSYFG